MVREPVRQRKGLNLPKKKKKEESLESLETNEILRAARLRDGNVSDIFRRHFFFFLFFVRNYSKRKVEETKSRTDEIVKSRAKRHSATAVTFAFERRSAGDPPKVAQSSKQAGTS